METAQFYTVVRRSVGVSIFATILLASRPALSDAFTVSGVLGSADQSAAALVVKEAYRRLGHQLDIDWQPGAKALELSNGGERDGELQRVDGVSKKFTNLIQLEIPVNFLQGGVYSRTQSFKVDGWYSLKPYRIGIVKGIVFAREGTQGMNVTEADNHQQLFEHLRDGVVDIVVVPRINGQLAIKENKVPGLKEMDGVLETLFLYHYVHKKHAQLVPALESTLKTMLLDGTTRKLRTQAHADLLK